MEPSEFEVTDHFAMRGRGVVVSGHPRSGRFRKGMLVHTGDDPPVLTVSGWEISHTVERTTHYAVVFRDAPSLEFVKKVFPVGSMLHGEEPQPVDR